MIALRENAAQTEILNPTPVMVLDEAPAQDEGTAFGKVVQIYRDNQRLTDRLRELGNRIAYTRSYLAEPGCNVLSGKANLWHLKAKYSATLTLLRANRLEAERLLEGIELNRQIHLY